VGINWEGSQSKILDIKYTLLSSSVCKDVINLTVCLTARGSPSVFMNFVMWEHCTSVN
jgi:hypothetical protein